MRHLIGKPTPMTISIPTPCSEKWENFTPTDKGGFCSSCQKDVIDFTNLSDDQIKLFFTDYSTNVCGRFSSGQLTSYRKESRNKTTLFKYIPASLLSLTLLLPPNESHAQAPLEKTEAATRTLGMVVTNTTDVQLPTQISGIAWLDSYQRAKNSVVQLKGAPIQTMTDSLGRFAIEIPNRTITDTLQFLAEGKDTYEVAIGNRSILRVNISRGLSPTMTLTMGAVAVACEVPRRRTWNKIKNIFKRN